MQQRTKWKQNFANIKLDTIVLIKEDNVPPNNWRLGRVVALHPSQDGIVPVVPSDKVIKRAVVKVCPLPSSEEQSTSIDITSKFILFLVHIQYFKLLSSVQKLLIIVNKPKKIIFL